MRKRIFEIIELGSEDDKVSRLYDAFMMICIVASLIPLTVKTEPYYFVVLDKVTAGIFTIDYLLRLATADYKYNNPSPASFIRYPFSAMAIIDLLSITPSFIPVNRAFKVFRMMRMFRAVRVLKVVKTVKVFRVAKVARYSKSLEIIKNVLVNSRAPLLSVTVFAFAYILISALIIFNVEPDSFSSFFDAAYWATVSLTTVGYGDIYPTSIIGRIVAMISSIFGIAIIALPAGIITAGYMEEVMKSNKEN